MSRFRLVDLHQVSDPRGGLAVLEPSRLGLFDCRRLFIVHDVPGDATRGAHAHRECHQLLIAASGALTVDVDDGAGRRTFRLEGPGTGLYLPPLTWGVQREFSAGCALVVLASHDYDPADYIHDEDEFRALARAGR